MENPINKKPTFTPPYGIFGNIFGRIWALWGIISFISTFLIIFLPSMLSYLFPQKKGQDYFIGVSKIWISIWLRIIGCPLKVYGLENFKPGETYVIVYNHNALLDAPLSAPFVPGGNKTIAKSSFAKVPIFGQFYKRGAVLVDRKSDASRRSSFEKMLTVLKQGMHMCIYPEGTRNRSSAAFKPFYEGAFKLAVEAKKDIIPCILLGTNRAMPIEKTFYLFPTKLRMIFLPPVSSAGIKSKELKDNVFNIMLAAYLKENKRV